MSEMDIPNQQNLSNYNSRIFFKTLQFIEEIHRSIDNSGIQLFTKSSILAQFGEFFIVKIVEIQSGSLFSLFALFTLFLSLNF